MTYDEVMDQLRARGDEKVLKQNAKAGGGENQFGVKTADLRDLAKKIKVNPKLAAELWDSGNIDAMRLATLLMKPKELSLGDLDRMVLDMTTFHVADWFGTNVLKLHPEKEAVRERWMDSKHEVTARMGWSLTAERITKNPDGLNLPALLDRIEIDMVNAPAEPHAMLNCKEWTMNYCLAEIGINFPEHRARAVAIGEKLGAFRGYPVSKGCVAPYAPIWIAEMVKRKG